MVSIDGTTDSLYGDPLDSSRFPHLGRERAAPSLEGPGSSDPPPPLRIGPYRITGSLGRGGMGEVFLAVDDRLARQVALKRIRPDRLGDEPLRHRFALEARVTALLQHPSIVPVYEAVEEGGTIFYTMRPVEGSTLREILDELRSRPHRARQEWPLVRLVRLFLQAMGAMAYAHSRGVIHRDLSPANVMIGPFEEVLVLDWGMAKVVPGADEVLDAEKDAGRGGPVSSLSGSGSIAGTPLYMAPERLRGEPATVHSDIFSLGVILYELVTLEYPWKAGTIDELHEAMRTPPEVKGGVRSGRSVPEELLRAVVRAAAFEPRDRYTHVGAFARDVAHAIEGRPTWHRDDRHPAPREWRLAGGRLLAEDSELALRSLGGAGGRFHLLSPGLLTENVRIEFDFWLPRSGVDLSVCLGIDRLDSTGRRSGYELQVVAGKKRILRLRRRGREVAAGPSPEYGKRRWYHCTVTREDDRLSLAVDGEEVYVYHDPIPLRSGHAGLEGCAQGLRLRGLEVLSRGAGARVSCLAVPDAFFHRGLYEDARQEYERIAAAHPGREEGCLAAYRAGLCLLELAGRENDPEMRDFLLAEADGVFERTAAANRSSLTYLGRAMVASARGDVPAKHAFLESALERCAEDPHSGAVREWLLARLHATDLSQRRVVAELLPLAMRHCMDDWGRRVVQELLQDVRRDWEVPSFLGCRGKFRTGDPVSLAEARVLFGFWSGRERLVEETVEELGRTGLLRPHHLADGVLSLLELGHPGRAGALLDRLQPVVGGWREPPAGGAALLRVAILAAEGKLGEATSLWQGVAPEPFDRLYNSARLWLARAWFDRGEAREALRSLRRQGPRDSFAREHRAWFFLHQEQVGQAEGELSLFVARGDHRTGRNLSNFLQGLVFLFRGRRETALELFRTLRPLDWPRTWTLGSHLALGRLGRGDLGAYLQGAFPWELRQLRSHARLLARAGGELAGGLPEELLREEPPRG